MPVRLNGNNTLEVSFWGKVIGAVLVAVLSAGSIGAVGSLLEVQALSQKLDVIEAQVKENKRKVEATREEQLRRTNNVANVGELRERLTRVDIQLQDHLQGH